MVYFYQAIGAFAAALCFVLYLISSLHPLELAALIFALNLLSVIMYFSATGKAKRLRNIALLGALPLLLISFPLAGPEWLHQKSSSILWYEHTFLASKNSVYTNLAITSKGKQYTFYANGSPYASTPAPIATVEEQVHFPLLFHPLPGHILMIGGGAGGFINEALKHPVEKIYYAEQDPLLIECFEEYATPLTRYELNHDKVRIHPVEGRLFLKKPPLPLFDLILINLPAPSTLLLNRYYTTQFFELAKNRLKQGGIFSISLPGSETFLTRELKELNKMIYSSLREVFPHVRIIVGAENILIASREGDVAHVDQQFLIQRLKERGISGGLMNEWYIRYKTDALRFGPIEDAILAVKNQPLNQDIHPAAVFKSMVSLNMIASPLMAKMLAGSADLPFSLFPGVIFLVVAMVCIYQKKRKSRLYLPVAISTTGFSTMAMNILLILAFQIIYGNIYHYIGLLTSLFMVGLAIGSRFSLFRPGTNLLFIESAILIQILLIALFFLCKPEAGPLSLSAIFLLTMISGTLTGLEFPLATHLLDPSSRAVSDTAGKLYAVDLVGGFFSALVTPILLIPVFGITKSLFLLFALKAGSLLIIYSGMKNSSKLPTSSTIRILPSKAN